MTRIVSTIFLAAAVLFGIWYLPLLAIQIIVWITIGIGLFEYAALVFERRAIRYWMFFIGFVTAAAMIWLPDIHYKTGYHQELILLPILIGAVFFTFLWVMRFHKPLEEAIHRGGLVILGICYLSLTLPIWTWIQSEGKEWVMLALFPTCLTDTFGFLVGKAVGRRKLAPNISPNKTWEGAVGSFFGATFGLWLANRLFFEPHLNITWLWYLFFGCTMSIIAIFGDLIESLIKRSVRVKDSSGLIPGHGGAMDRLDALTFAAPYFFFCVYPLLKKVA